ncbi:mechanosensitive ion channel family protein [Candidatus Vampirococcus lugosii]|uniref:Mechanosensitive ion channel MscS n=1 Tax=Candidatus Vampirococcus lugosii TaxID=2789015 RepID=A0ABS5QMG1_9BACT|nr:mechanosensitive ion channel domain-containing protein [Candidatus Vampirococcus lugosii]MBS8122154.1 mechanosensitive ion channel MscS [Candidatus Vampirococcus lugosii]
MKLNLLNTKNIKLFLIILINVLFLVKTYAQGEGTEEAITVNTNSSSIFDSNIFTIAIQAIIAILVTAVLMFISKIIAVYIRNRFINNINIPDNENAGEDDDVDVYSQRAGNLVSSMIFYPLLLISIFIGFQIIGFDIGILLGGLSVGIGFAFREILGNMFAGVMLLLTKEIKLGDKVELEKPNNQSYFGIIDEITIRYTVLRLIYDKRRVIIPNLDMITNPLKTYTSEDSIILRTFVLIHYEEDIQKACDVIIDAVNNSGLVTNKKLTKALISKIGDSGGDRDFTNNTSNGVEIRASFHIDPNVVLDGPPVILGKINHYIYKAILENNIRIPYPHTSVTVDKNDKNLLGSALYLMKNNK